MHRPRENPKADDWSSTTVYKLPKRDVCESYLRSSILVSIPNDDADPIVELIVFSFFRGGIKNPMLALESETAALLST